MDPRTCLGETGGPSWCKRLRRYKTRKQRTCQQAHKWRVQSSLRRRDLAFTAVHLDRRQAAVRPAKKATQQQQAVKIAVAKSAVAAGIHGREQTYHMGNVTQRGARACDRGRRRDRWARRGHDGHSRRRQSRGGPVQRVRLGFEDATEGSGGPVCGCRQSGRFGQAVGC